jgi:pilus assembly protein CpaE
MSDSPVIAIGAPPTFRHQVARALDREPATVEWMPTVAAAEGFLSGKDLPPRAVVLSPSVKEADAFGLAEFVGRSAPATAVLLVRDQMLNGNGLLAAAMRAGIRDVVDLSRGGSELREALDRAIAWSEILRSGGQAGADAAGPRGKVVSVFSSKGGAGKTFLACNLAGALSQVSGKDVAVVDLDLDLGDVFSYFGTEPTRSLHDLISLGDQADPEAVMGLGTKLHPNLWGFAAPPDPAAKTVGGEAIGKALRALREAFDYTVIDATAEYSDAVLAAFDLSDSVCLVAGLDVVGARHLATALETLLAMGFPRERFHIVLNRADSKVGLAPVALERVLKVKVDSMIPSSRLVPLSLNVGRPVVFEEPKSQVSRALTALAKRFLVEAEAPSRKRGVFRSR